MSQDIPSQNSLLEQEARQLETQTKILNYSASPKTAKRWFLYLDPLNELGEANSTEAILPLLKRENKINDTCEAAATIMLSSISRPDIVPSQYQWINNLKENAPYNSFTKVSNKLNPSPHGALEIVIKDLKSKTHSEEDLKNIYIAAQMLRYAGTGMLPDIVYCNKNGKEFMLNRKKVDFNMAGELYDVIMSNALKPEQSTKIKLIGLNALWEKGMGDLANLNLEKDNNSAYIKNLILTTKNILSTFTKEDYKSSIGNIYELMWILDAYLYGKISGKNPEVFPTFTFQDEPNIPNLSARRGIDVVIVANNEHIPIQLKSYNYSKTENKRQEAKKYHSKIIVLDEGSRTTISTFDKLANKLNAYMPIIPEKPRTRSARREAQRHMFTSAINFISSLS